MNGLLILFSNAYCTQDLKKQTALRLAQEQGREGSVETPQIGTPSHPQVPYHPTPDRQSYFGKSPQYDSPYRPDVLYPEQQWGKAYRSPAARTFSASESVDSAPQGATSKLPHGLTVSELKEMTKARLAAEKSNPTPNVAIPTTVQVSHRNSPLPSRQQIVRSPYPDAEAWETASASTSASEYPATESVYSGNYEDVPIVRSGSYVSHTSDWSEQPPVYTNRCRASTVSPRPNHLLIREDRPLHPIPALPTDLNAPSLHRHPNPPPGAFATDRIIYGNRARTASAPQVVDYNRVRTSSTLSLPASSRTTEEFSSSGYVRSFDDIREDSSVTGLSDVFRESSLSCSTLQGFGSAQSSLGLGTIPGGNTIGDNRHRAMTDFGIIGQDLVGSDLSGGSGSDLRIRAATWGGCDVFGSSADLSEDLASILKLSGAEQKDDEVDDLFSPR
jgi:hypothetical protein